VTASAVSRADVEPVAHETLDRVITGLVTGVPVLVLGVAAWQVWDRLLGWHDIVVFAVMYVATGLGVTVGFHRHLTHRSFETSRGLRATLAIVGSAAVEGPVIPWVANHRKHHAFSDEEGDPHSPHVGHGGGLRGAVRGLVHAHLGWLFVHDQRGSKRRYAPDLLRDPVIRFVDKTFPLWAVLGLAAAFGLGIALGGTIGAGLTALLWGGGVRVFVVHHVTYSINRSATRSGAARSRRTTSRAIWPGSPHWPWARRGTTTTTPFPPPPSTGCAAGNPIPPPGSSPASSGSGSSGTSFG
jgi:stearoyl-CoA desaturase (delta-9 desaturase)